MKEPFNPARVLKLLQQDKDSIPWSERRDIVIQIAQALQQGAAVQSVMPLLRILADDSKPEVRKEVAEALQLLPEKEFLTLSAKLAEDDSFFVKKAVQRALGRKRKGQDKPATKPVTVFVNPDDEKSIVAIQALASMLSQQMADKRFDELVGVVIHNIRGILSPMYTDLETIVKGYDCENPDVNLCRESANKTIERLQYLQKFIEDMRTYSHATPEELHRERLVNMVHEARGIVLDELRVQGYDVEGVSLVIDVSEELTAEVCKHQIVIAITHLLKNAYDSFRMPKARESGRTIRVSAKQRDSENIELVVQDNGPGLSLETLEEIRKFKIGNTVKKNMGGTGFGLATVDKYIRAHGGWFGIHSRGTDSLCRSEADGFTAVISLPIDHEEA